MPPITREQKIELLQRSLGIKHKLKVHDSMKAPETHEEMAVSMMARWELEDELTAIEKLLGQARNENVDVKMEMLEKDYLKAGGKNGSKAKKK